MADDTHEDYAKAMTEAFQARQDRQRRDERLAVATEVFSGLLRRFPNPREEHAHNLVNRAYRLADLLIEAADKPTAPRETEHAPAVPVSPRPPAVAEPLPNTTSVPDPAEMQRLLVEYPWARYYAVDQDRDAFVYAELPTFSPSIGWWNGPSGSHQEPISDHLRLTLGGVRCEHSLVRLVP
jgi:hypothetical protein